MQARRRRERAGAVFADKTDPDYQKILALCRAGEDYLDQIKRFDVPGFQPPAMNVGEMKRFGILPATLGPADTALGSKLSIPAETKRSDLRSGGGGKNTT